jgi:hypothetical protein
MDQVPAEVGLPVGERRRGDLGVERLEELRLADVEGGGASQADAGERYAFQSKCGESFCDVGEGHLVVVCDGSRRSTAVFEPMASAVSSLMIACGLGRASARNPPRAGASSLTCATYLPRSFFEASSCAGNSRAPAARGRPGPTPRSSCRCSWGPAPSRSRSRPRPRRAAGGDLAGPRPGTGSRRSGRTRA